MLAPCAAFPERPPRESGGSGTPPAAPSELLLRALLDHAAVGVAFFDADLRYLYANAYTAAITGHTPQALVGRTLAEVVGAEFGTDAARDVLSRFRRTLQSGESFTVRTWGAPARTQGGEVRSFDWTIRRAADAQGAVLGVALTVAEVSERTRAERERQRLLESERGLRHATEAIAGLFSIEEVIHEITEQARRATGADHAFVERLDGERGELEIVAASGRRVPAVGTRIPYAGSLAEEMMQGAELVRVLDLDLLRVHGRLPSYLDPAGGDGMGLMVHLTDAGGAIGTLFLLREAGRQPFRPDEIERAGTFASLAALGFRKIHLLHDAERRREEMQQVMASRDRLIQGFSHDLRNPLGAALLHLQILELTDGLGEQQTRMLARIRSSVHSAVKLAGDMLKLALAEAGTLRIEPGAVDIRAAAREAAEEHRAQAAEKGMRVSLDLPSQLPIIETDWTRLHQILGNLVSNAVKYTDQGEITLRVEEEEEGGEEAPHPGHWICVAVSDTGPGIPESQREHVFEEFTRLDPRRADGAGLGLAISRRIARALGGEITLQSQEGRGSTFTLWLPFDPVAQHAGERSSGNQEARARRPLPRGDQS